MRKTIAQRMLQAKQTAPEIHVTVNIRADRLVAAREELNKRLAREGIKLSLGDFVTKAVALSLRAHPGVNASYEPDAIVRHGEVNIGIAVALPEGLIVPVLQRADTLGLREIRQQSEALAAAARANSLTGEQLTGSTFTISNLGMYGVREFDAILNMPEVGILAVGAAEKRPVVEGDRLVVGTVMTVTLTADHRAVERRHGRRVPPDLEGAARRTNRHAPVSSCSDLLTGGCVNAVGRRSPGSVATGKIPTRRRSSRCSYETSPTLARSRKTIIEGFPTGV